MKTLMCLILCLIVTLCFATPVVAGHCNVNAVQLQTFAAPVQVQTFAAPVAVQSYSAVQTFAAPVQTFAAPVAVQTYAAPVAVAQPVFQAPVAVHSIAVQAAPVCTTGVCAVRSRGNQAVRTSTRVKTRVK